MSNFVLDMSKFTAKTEKQLSQVVRETAIGLFSAVMRSSPVDSGRARGAWMFTIAQPSNVAPINIRSEGEVEAEILTGTASYRPGDTLWFSNNVSYILPLEYGHSQQSPQGMVRLNVMKFQAFVNKASKGL